MPRKDDVLPPVRIAAAEHDLLRRAASVSGLSLSEFVRRCSLEHARRVLVTRGCAVAPE